MGNSTQELSTANARALERLLHQLDLHRNPLATDTNHALYRGAPERWLESIVLEDPAKLDALLDTRHFDSQVPALAAGDRGVLDPLGITRQGRLVVIELKASEDLRLPVQAVDYWLRLRHHQREGDFQRNGYFAGVARLIRSRRWSGSSRPACVSVPPRRRCKNISCRKFTSPESVSPKIGAAA